MKSYKLSIPNENISALPAEIARLQREINRIEGKLLPFEQALRNAVGDVLVEERELTILYKAQKKAKKEKRLAQKKRGKNYKASTGLKVIAKDDALENKEDVRQKKRLYKEAMLQVHPDKFSMKEVEQQLATEITTKLIEIYKTGTLEELEEYHAHIFKGNSGITLKNLSVKVFTISSDTFSLKEKVRLENQLQNLLSSYTYHVLTTYKNPMLFVNELLVYYNDRIFKLKKRTRTK